MRTEVPAVVSKLETCEQETGWADFISIEISKKALFCRPTLFRNEFRELLIRGATGPTGRLGREVLLIRRYRELNPTRAAYT